MTDLLSTVSTALASHLRCRRWVIAYSGGLDSRVLLHLAWCLQQSALRRGDVFPELSAIHINHQLQSVSGDWAEQCQAVCKQYGISFQARLVEVQGHRQGIESLAREARYRVFEELIDDDSVLLLGHHQDDQVETFFLRLLRGAGAAGLAAMPVTRRVGSGVLVRPLLDVSRAVLESYANSQGLAWIEDPSNSDSHYRRNFLRHRVMPVVAEAWPMYRNTIVAAAALQAETSLLLDSYLNADIAKLSDEDGNLKLAELREFDTSRQRALLRQFVLLRTEQRLDQAQTRELAEQFLHSSNDSQPIFVVNKAMTLRAFRGRLYCVPESVSGRFDSERIFDWRGGECEISGLGRLSSSAGGKFVPRGNVTVRFRRGGERCRIAGHAHSKSLKNLLQEWGVPPWRRDTLPLIYCDDDLAAIADIAICEGFWAADQEFGLILHWRWSR